jgi:hypothetical protein
MDQTLSQNVWHTVDNALPSAAGDMQRGVCNERFSLMRLPAMGVNGLHCATTHTMLPGPSRALYPIGLFQNDIISNNVLTNKNIMISSGKIIGVPTPPVGPWGNRPKPVTRLELLLFAPP